MQADVPGPRLVAPKIVSRRVSTSGPEASRPRRYVPLFYRVAAINVLLLVIAVGVTIAVLLPSHESAFRIEEEGIVLGVVVVLVVLLNTFLLRRAVRPVQELTDVARTVDLSDATPRLPDSEPNSEAGELAATFEEMLARLRAERSEATGRVLAAQEAERLRIAQELHDQVGQELTAVLLLLARVQSRVPEDIRLAVGDAQESVRSSLEDLRRIAIELRPEALDDLGLESALAVLGDRLTERSSLAVMCRIPERLPELSSEAELVIYRVAQEALTNVARHSGSDRAELSLRPEDGRVILTVIDEGCGLAPSQEPGSGMKGMRERAALVEAALEIHNRKPGPGAEVRLEVPLGGPR
jgi:two-component system, NarL family, sensor histidine kinase UhpB